MTTVEQLKSVATGSSGGVAPTLSFNGAQADLNVGAGEGLKLGWVDSPSTLAIRSDLDKVQDDPAAGGARLDELKSETKSQIGQRLSEGADGIFYYIDGAFPQAMSPMEYGGLFLEMDREILAEQKGLTVVYNAGKETPFADFTSDLPCDFFCWDAESGVTVSELRQLRSNGLGTQSGDADLKLLDQPIPTTSNWISEGVASS